MKNKLSLLLLLLTFALIILCSFHISKTPDSLVFATPKSNDTIGLSAAKIEDMNDDGLMLTYTSKKPAALVFSNANFDCNLIRTNYKYPYVTGYPLGTGGFFTKTEQRNTEAVAVLNEFAAFEIFGTTDISGNTFEIEGITYTVRGVISDGELKTSNVYVPMDEGEFPQNLIGKVDINKAAASAELINSLKINGISENGYNIIPTADIHKLFYQKLKVGALAIAMGLLVILLSTIISNFKKSVASIHSFMQVEYISDIVKNHKIMLLKIFTLCIAILAAGACMLYMFVMITYCYLDIRALHAIGSWAYKVHIADKIQLDISDFNILSDFLPIVLISSAATYFYGIMNRKEDKHGITGANQCQQEIYTGYGSC